MHSPSLPSRAVLGLFHGCDGQNSAGFLKFSRWKCRLRKEGRRKGTEGKKERGERGFWLVLLLEILPPPLLLPPPPPLVAPLARCFQFRTRLEFRFLWSTTLCTPLLPVLFNPALGFGQALQLRAFFLFSILRRVFRSISATGHTGGDQRLTEEGIIFKTMAESPVHQ